MQDEQPTIDAALARRLVAEQFPHWAHLPVRAMPTQGWDNRSFLLGSGMVLRLPSAQAYAAQVPREQRWLPYLRRHLPVEIPQPLAQGRPGCGYPFAWSVYRWIDGDTVASRPPSDLHLFVTDLARFLNALRAVPAADGPAAGEDNFHRGGALGVYDAQAREAFAVCATGSTPRSRSACGTPAWRRRGRSRRSGFTATSRPGICWSARAG